MPGNCAGSPGSPGCPPSWSAIIAANRASMCVQGVDELQQRDRPAAVGGPQRHFRQPLASADAEQVADTAINTPALASTACTWALSPERNATSLARIAHQLPQLARRRWGDPRLGQSVHPQQISQIGGVADVVLHPPVPKSLDSQWVCQMHRAPAACSASTAQYQPYVASSTTSGCRAGLLDLQPQRHRVVDDAHRRSCSPDSDCRTITDRRRCRSIPTNCLPSYSSIGAS